MTRGTNETNPTIVIEKALQDYETREVADDHDNRGCLSIFSLIIPLLPLGVINWINNPQTSTQVIDKILRL